MRALLIGAFPFPLAQGSQVYLADQARALLDAGARITLATYARGSGALPDALAGCPRIATPRALSPAVLRSGFAARKPLVDSALAIAIARAHRARPFDVALAHNAEAALAAAAARALGGPPFVYVAHTLLGEELPAWLPARLEPVARRLGERLDRHLAGTANGVLALCAHAAQRLAAHARGPLETIPPGLDAAALPAERAQERACAALGLERRSFFLYTGNLDRYQELPLLAHAARARAGGPERSAAGRKADPAAPLPIVVATHDEAGARAARARLAPLHVVAMRGPGAREQLRALCAAATALLLPRRRPGGFPIKLLNYMEAARPTVAFAPVAAPLVDGSSGWLLAPDAGAPQWAAALRTLASEPERADAMGAAARRVLLREHAWPALAARTLALARSAAQRA